MQLRRASFDVFMIRAFRFTPRPRCRCLSWGPASWRAAQKRLGGLQFFAQVLHTPLQNNFDLSIKRTPISATDFLQPGLQFGIHSDAQEDLAHFRRIAFHVRNLPEVLPTVNRNFNFFSIIFLPGIVPGVTHLEICRISARKRRFTCLENSG